MLDDFTPIILNLPGRETRIWAIADVHLGARECDLQAFKSFIKRVESADDNYIVIVGDLLSNGVKDSLTNVYEELIPPSAQIDLAVEILQPIADKIIGGVGGNHEHRSKKAVDLDPLYCVFSMLRNSDGESLQSLYRQNIEFIRVILKNDKSTHDTYAIMLTHGKTANKKRQFAYSIEGVDAIISGHTHDGILEKPAKIVFTKSNRVKIKPVVSLTATSWISWGGYAARSLMQAKTTSDPQCLILPFTGSNNTQGQIRVSW